MLTHNDHFSWTYDSGKTWGKLRRDPTQRYDIRFGRAQQDIRNWRVANRMAAQAIRADTDEPITLLISGGMDSELMALAFIDAGIKFDCAVARYADDINGEEIRHAFDFFQRYDITPRLLELNVTDFWLSGEVLEYAAPVQCDFPEHATHLWLIDQVQGYVVTGMGDLALNRHRPPRTGWYHREQERWVSQFRHFALRRRSGTTAFLRYLPEQWWAYLHLPGVAGMLHDEIEALSYQDGDVKHAIYSQAYPELKLRRKLDGFEDLRGIRTPIMEQLRTMFPFSPNTELWLEADEVRNMVRPLER